MDTKWRNLQKPPAMILCKQNNMMTATLLGKPHDIKTYNLPLCALD